MQDLVTVKGVVSAVIFHNEDNGYTVLEVETDDELLTIVGNMPDIGEGDQITAVGEYSSHQSFGLQFKAESVEISLPENIKAIEKYLSSGAIKGVGPILAKRIVEMFGKETFNIIENNPEQLKKVKGISPSKAEDIEDEFKKVHGMRSVMTFLMRFNIPSIKGVRLWKLYGPISLELVKTDPFVLCIEQIGVNFHDADKIRKALDMPPYESVRLKAGLLFTLQSEQWNGHSCLPKNILFKKASELLNVSEELLFEELEGLIERQTLITLNVDDIIYIYIADTYDAEKYIATHFKVVLESSTLKISKEQIKEIKTQITELEAEHSIDYAEKQKEAIEMALTSPTMILTGGPGTGKTTILNAMIELFEKDHKKVGLVAPTGRAAKRMSDLTGKEAKTIHRLLGVNFDENGKQVFIHNEDNLLNYDVLIADELSMVDVFLFRDLLKAIKLSTQLILVGDVDQLPPVGVGNVLKDLIDSKKIPTVELKEIFRQASKSLIVTNAHKIIEGDMPNIKDVEHDFFFIQRKTPTKVKETVIELCSTRLPKAYDYSPLWDIQVLCPTRVGGVGTAEINNLMQETLNPPSKDKNSITYGAYTFREGDKVMQTKNNYDIIYKIEGAKKGEEQGTGIFNGDIGTILMIDKRSRSLKIQFDDRIADYMIEQLNEIELAYAITVHKSQGSEFKAVILPLFGSSRMHYRNLLYTAVTRASEKLIIVGDQRVISEMIKNVITLDKYTNLKYFLEHEIN